MDFFVGNTTIIMHRIHQLTGEALSVPPDRPSIYDQASGKADGRSLRSGARGFLPERCVFHSTRHLFFNTIQTFLSKVDFYKESMSADIFSCKPISCIQRSYNVLSWLFLQPILNISILFLCIIHFLSPNKHRFIENGNYSGICLFWNILYLCIVLIRKDSLGREMPRPNRLLRRFFLFNN